MRRVKKTRSSNNIIYIIVVGILAVLIITGICFYSYNGSLQDIHINKIKSCRDKLQIEAMKKRYFDANDLEAVDAIIRNPQDFLRLEKEKIKEKEELQERKRQEELRLYKERVRQYLKRQEEIRKGKEE